MDEDDKKKMEELGKLSDSLPDPNARKTMFINESGLYSLMSGAAVLSGPSVCAVVFGSLGPSPSLGRFLPLGTFLICRLLVSRGFCVYICWSLWDRCPPWGELLGLLFFLSMGVMVSDGPSGSIFLVSLRPLCSMGGLLGL